MIGSAERLNRYGGIIHAVTKVPSPECWDLLLIELRLFLFEFSDAISSEWLIVPRAPRQKCWTSTVEE